MDNTKLALAEELKLARIPWSSYFEALNPDQQTKWIRKLKHERTEREQNARYRADKFFREVSRVGQWDFNSYR